jgi:hypothetical protein
VVRDALDGFAQLRRAVASLTAEHVPDEALAVRADQRHRCALTGVHGGGAITEPEREVLPADETVEAEHSGEW